MVVSYSLQQNTTRFSVLAGEIPSVTIHIYYQISLSTAKDKFMHSDGM